MNQLDKLKENLARKLSIFIWVGYFVILFVILGTGSLSGGLSDIFAFAFVWLGFLIALATSLVARFLIKTKNYKGSIIASSIGLVSFAIIILYFVYIAHIQDLLPTDLCKYTPRGCPQV